MARAGGASESAGAQRAGGAPRRTSLRRPRRTAQGGAVKFVPIKRKWKAPGIKRSKLNCDVLLSTSAFKFTLCRYTKDTVRTLEVWGLSPKLLEVRRCKLTLSNTR